MLDTNCDPEPIDYIIPGNDDAIRAVSLIAGAMANAVIEAKEGVSPVTEESEGTATETEKMAEVDNQALDLNEENAENENKDAE